MSGVQSIQRLFVNCHLPENSVKSIYCIEFEHIEEWRVIERKKKFTRIEFVCVHVYARECIWLQVLEARISHQTHRITVLNTNKLHLMKCERRYVVRTIHFISRSKRCLKLDLISKHSRCCPNIWSHFIKWVDRPWVSTHWKLSLFSSSSRLFWIIIIIESVW